jgi:hypothetical protein
MQLGVHLLSARLNEQRGASTGSRGMQSPVWRQPARREAQKDCGGSRSPPAPRYFLSAAPGGKNFRGAGLASINIILTRPFYLDYLDYQLL